MDLYHDMKDKIGSNYFKGNYGNYWHKGKYDYDPERNIIINNMGRENNLLV